MSEIDHGRECTYCKCPYVKPCDGKNAECMNKLHRDKLKAKEEAK